MSRPQGDTAPRREMQLEEYSRIVDAEHRHWWYRAMPKLARAVLGPRLRPGMRILDAGCGPGANFTWLREFGEVTGVDTSPEALRLARARHPEMTVAEADVTALPFADESFDLTLEITVLTMVEHDQRAVDELARVTAGGGTVFLMEPAVPRLHRAHDEVVRSLRRYRLDDLRAMAGRAGLVVRRATHANSFLLPPAAALALAHRLRPPRGEPGSDMARDRLGGTFSALATMERRVLVRRDVSFGLSAIVVAERP